MPSPPPPLPPTGRWELRYATSADLVCGQLGPDYEIRDVADCYRGLFPVRRFLKGQLVARYGGTRCHEKCLSPGHKRTHILRVPDSNDLIDGWPLARALVRSPCCRFWLPAPCSTGARSGHASLANSGKPNTRIVFVADDSGARPLGYDARRPTLLGKPIWFENTHLPRAAYLEATCDIEVVEEVLWEYQYDEYDAA